MNECTCNIDVDLDYGCIVDVIEDTRPVAKKEHKCNECSVIIEPGQKYSYEKYVLNGGITVHRMCLDCLSIRENLFCWFMYENLWQEIHEHLSNYGIFDGSCIDELKPRGRDMVCDVIEEYWENEDE